MKGGLLLWLEYYHYGGMHCVFTIWGVFNEIKNQNPHNQGLYKPKICTEKPMDCRGKSDPRKVDK